MEMKGLLNYIWKNRLLPKSRLHTTEGEKLRVINYGLEDEEKNIFRNAGVRIGDKEWHGDVEIHEAGLEHESGANDATILHLTAEGCIFAGTGDCTTAVLCLRIPEGLGKEFADAMRHSQCLPCHEAIGNLDAISRNGYLSRLMIERIEEKAGNILHTFSECNGLWDDALLKTMIRSFGFGIQGDVFERWAKVLDFNALGKHRDNLLQVEAIMLGQAGLLEEESIPYYYMESAKKSTYYNELLREYRFLKNKFGLKNIDCKEWGNGSATPHVRIARIAALYSTKRIGFSSITACNTIAEYYRLIDTTLEGYWSNHACLGGTETWGNGGMKQRQMDVIIINAVIPLLYIYGKHRNDTAACDKAEELLHQLKGEENSITRKWADRGMPVCCAADSQAILQLERKYCRMHNCLECRFACHYIKERLAQTV